MKIACMQQSIEGSLFILHMSISEQLSQVSEQENL